MTFSRLFLATALLACAAPAAAQRHARLDALVAEMLPRVESLSGLRAIAPLAVASRSRAELEEFLRQSALEVADSGDVRASQIAYRLLGLLPDSIDLLELAPELLGEQIAGYYDFTRDTLYILDDVPPGQLRSIVAHEMTHALQDQHFRLDSLVARDLGNDAQMAVRAAIEGHATLVMLIVGLEDLTGEPLPFEELPDLTRLPLEALMPGTPSPAFARAPRILRESGAFPYGRGVGFAHALRTRDPDAVPFLASLPESTEQVVDPYGRFLDGPDPPARITLADSAGGGPWTAIYENTLGQFELSVLLMERHRLQSEQVAQGWGGDRYRVLTDGSRHALEWFIVWDEPRARSRFVSTYTQIIGVRMGRTGLVEAIEIDGRPGVRIVEAENGVSVTDLPRARPHLLGTGGAS